MWVAVGREALIAAVVLVEAQAGEIVGELEDTGTTGKMTRRYVKAMQVCS